MTRAASARGRLLVVDDERLNRMLLTHALKAQGYAVKTAENGRQALALLEAESGSSFDVVLLDLLMPDQDGFETLAHIKARDGLRHLPVIIISAIDEMDSVICCMKMGATDYLPRPFDGALLQARISASLASKRLRDLELEYLEQVECVTAAAADLENGQFEIADLDPVAARDDALGQLARVFQRMAREVRARQDCLERDARALRIEIDHVRQAEKVVEITETEYYQHLRAQAEDLRRILAG